jgi:hypothetical protein
VDLELAAESEVVGFSEPLIRRPVRLSLEPRERFPRRRSRLCRRPQA